MRLIITRHGETEENKQGIIQGHLPGKLSKLGIEQARRLAQRLKTEKIDVTYSSDLARAADTAKAIMKFHTGIPVHYTEDLRERNPGEFQGVKKSDMGWDKEKSHTNMPQPKKGETLEQLFRRGDKFLHELLKKHLQDNVLCVGHNGIGKAIICAIQNKGSEDMPKTENLKNTSIYIFEIDEERNHSIHLYNCTKHLA